MEQTMKGYLFRLLNHEELSREEMKTILIGITQSEYPNEQITALLTCLQMRGVTVDELLGFRDGILEFFVSYGLEIFKGQVIEFNLDPADAETLCYRAVNVECLTSDPYLALGRLVLERTHIVKAVGKFDHYDTDVTCHCIEHLTEVLSLHLKLFIRLVGNPRKRNALEFCHTGYEKRNLVSELLTHHRLGYFGIFENVMEKSRTYGLLVHFEFGQDYRYIKGMDDIRLTGFPDLSLVGIVSYRISLFDH